MILGTGIDLVEVDRIRASIARHGDRFLEKFLLPDEIAYARTHADPALPVAARWAAKEAVAKAFGTGFGKELGWCDIEIIRDGAGAPKVALYGRAKKLSQRLGATRIHLSLTHEKLHAAAFAVVER